MATHSNGIAALQLQAQLGLDRTSRPGCCAPKLRRAMVGPGRAPLAGLVDVLASQGPSARRIVLLCTHRVFANLKTWALGVYHPNSGR